MKWKWTSERHCKENGQLFIHCIDQVSTAKYLQLCLDPRMTIQCISLTWFVGMFPLLWLYRKVQGKQTNSLFCNCVLLMFQAIWKLKMKHKKEAIVNWRDNSLLEISETCFHLSIQVSGTCDSLSYHLLPLKPSVSTCEDQLFMPPINYVLMLNYGQEVPFN